MIGLGDIVLPGVLASFCCRIGFIRSFRKKPQYRLFYGSVVAYVLGLALTFLVHCYSGHAQPALVYIVPCMVVWVLMQERLALAEDDLLEL